MAFGGGKKEEHATVLATLQKSVASHDKMLERLAEDLEKLQNQQGQQAVSAAAEVEALSLALRLQPTPLFGKPRTQVWYEALKAFVQQQSGPTEAQHQTDRVTSDMLNLRLKRLKEEILKEMSIEEKLRKVEAYFKELKVEISALRASSEQFEDRIRKSESFLKLEDQSAEGASLATLVASECEKVLEHKIGADSAIAKRLSDLENSVKTFGEQVAKELKESKELILIVELLGEFLYIEELAQFQAYLPRLQALARRLREDVSCPAPSLAQQDYHRLCCDASNILVTGCEEIREEVFSELPQQSFGQTPMKRLEVLQTTIHSLPVSQRDRFHELGRHEFRGLFDDLYQNLLRPLYWGCRDAQASEEERQALRRFEGEVWRAFEEEVSLRMLAPPEGIPFDESRMYAETGSSNPAKSGCVEEIVEPGYEWDGHVMQTAKVKVYLS